MRTSTTWCDAGSFVEYGPLVIAAQRRRRPVRRPHRPHPGRRPGRRGRHGGRPADGGPDLRLHGARRHPGLPEPPQEGPPVRARRASAPPGGVLHRGRRRAARRHRRPGRVGPRLAWRSICFGRLSGLVPLVGITSGRCFAGNAAILGLLRRRDRHAGLEHRHGRSGDDRGRRARRVRARGHRPDRRPGGQRRGRRGGRRRGRGRGGRAAATCPTSPGRPATGPPATSARCAT